MSHISENATDLLPANRGMNPWAVISIVLAAMATFASFGQYTLLCIVRPIDEILMASVIMPVVAALAGVALAISFFALRQIRLSSSRGSGRRLAWVGLTVSCAILGYTLGQYWVQPWLSHGEGPDRQSPCMNNQRRMIIRIQEYIQDTDRLPGTDWMSLGVPSAMVHDPKVKVWSCGPTPVCYGYNGALVDRDGRGIPAAAIQNLTEVGVLCDTEAQYAYPLGGVVGTAQAMPAGTLLVAPAYRHGDNMFMAFYDGHIAVVRPHEYPDYFTDVRERGTVKMPLPAVPHP